MFTITPTSALQYTRPPLERNVVWKVAVRLKHSGQNFVSRRIIYQFGTLARFVKVLVLGAGEDRPNALETYILLKGPQKLSFDSLVSVIDAEVELLQSAFVLDKRCYDRAVVY